MFDHMMLMHDDDEHIVQSTKKESGANLMGRIAFSWAIN